MVSISKSIGYALIAIGIVAVLFAIFMMASLPDNVFAILLGLVSLIIGLVLLGLGAIAAKK